jgi:hypothetical protein
MEAIGAGIGGGRMSKYRFAIRIPVEYVFELDADSREEAVEEAKQNVFEDLSFIGLADTVDGCIAFGFYHGDITIDPISDEDYPK